MLLAWTIRISNVELYYNGVSQHYSEYLLTDWIKPIVFISGFFLKQQQQEAVQACSNKVREQNIKKN